MSLEGFLIRDGGESGRQARAGAAQWRSFFGQRGGHERIGGRPEGDRAEGHPAHGPSPCCHPEEARSHQDHDCHRRWRKRGLGGRGGRGACATTCHRVRCHRTRVAEPHLSLRCRSQEGWTALMYAVAVDSVACVDELLRADADFNKKTEVPLMSRAPLVHGSRAGNTRRFRSHSAAAGTRCRRARQRCTWQPA